MAIPPENFDWSSSVIVGGDFSRMSSWSYRGRGRRGDGDLLARHKVPVEVENYARTRRLAPVEEYNDDYQSCIDDDLDCVTPPPVNGEYSRVKSPAPSTHSSDYDDTDLSVYIEKRNEAIRKEFLKQQMELTPAEQRRNLYKSLLKQDNRIIYYNVYQDVEDLAESEPNNNRYQFNDTMNQIISDAVNKPSSYFDSIPGSSIGGIQFCYMRFQRALQLKWNILMLSRFEDILGGRGKLLLEMPKELLDFEGEFARIYGPVVVTDENYKKLLTQFGVQRMKMYIDMIERERDVIQFMLESGKRIAAWSFLELEIREKRLRMETGLNAIPEANLDINPYTNKIGMDFFVLPRPTHSIVSYKVRPKGGVEHLIEYNFKDKEDGVVVIEGYNPAVLDIGCQFPRSVVGNERQREHFMMTASKQTAGTDWCCFLLKLKAEVQEHPVGIGSKELVNKYQQPWLDVFYMQLLGKDKRVILFPSVFEGLIITPEEILLRVWNKIKLMLELHKSVKVDDLQIQYKKFFGQPLYPLRWGFADEAEFVQYSLQNFTEELAYVSCVEEEEVNPKAIEEPENDDTGKDDKDDDPIDSGNACLRPSHWQRSDEPFPSNYVFKELLLYQC
ncbi:hypothetical protein Ocin01_12478 [Orchesella cincta]|uniref:Uncharacterized protein n=1 Tax=Orchesella cincta TaxID=48709 RepID=A0A1D2MMK9_ORCCI|nr:hypothetical protein Ocin01_12478 [Orchesella cincta]